MATFREALELLRDRILLMQAECIPASKAAESYASFNYQTNFPYWTTRVGNVAPPPEPRGEAFFTYTVPIVMRLVVGYSGMGYEGEIENRLQWEYIPDVLTYFQARPQFQTEKRQSRPPFLDVESTRIGCTGLALYTLNDRSYIGTEFPITTQFTVTIEKAF